MTDQGLSGRMLTRKEFADGENLSLCTVDRLISSGKIEAYKFGRLTRIPETERVKFRASLIRKKVAV
jgi:excisionase family DNA binding protein